MAVRSRVWIFGLVMICGLVIVPPDDGNKALGQGTSSPTQSPLQNPGMGMPESTNGSHLESPVLRPWEKPLPINLATALGIANVQPWDILAASDRVRIASAQLTQSNVLWLPTLYTGGVYQTHAGGTQSADGAISSPSSSAFEFGTTPQFVFACTEAIFEPLASRRVLQARKAELQAVTNDTTYAVARAYFDVLQARGELAAAGEVLHRSDELIRKIKVMAPDLVPQVEVARAEAQYARFRQAERSARERWNVVSAELVRVLRLDPTAVLVPLEPPHLQVTLISPEQPLEALLPVALAARPELTAYRELTEAALKRWREEQYRPLLPLVLARGNSTQTPDPLAIGVFGGGPGGSMSNFRTRFDYEVQVLWELRNLGLGNLASIRQRRAEYDVTKIQAYRLQDFVAREVSEAFAQLQSARDRLGMAEDEMQKAKSSANDNFKGLGEVRRVGGQIVSLVIRPLEAIAAQQALLQGYYDYFGAVGDYNRTQFQLYRALGNPAQALPMLDKVLNEARPPANPDPPPPAPGPAAAGGDAIPNAAIAPVGNTVALTLAPSKPAIARVQVRVPAEALVFCDNVKMDLTGTERNFTSPPLPPGRSYPYQIRVRWNGPDGKLIELVRSIQVEAGRHITLDFVELARN
jgi:uncharacterized protein (TIGR03000 family)